MKATFIAGPCVIESAELLDTVAAKLVDINKRLVQKSYSRPRSTRPTARLLARSAALELTTDC